MPSFLKHCRSSRGYILKQALDVHFYSENMLSVRRGEQRSVKFFQHDASNSARTWHVMENGN
jgi:hypothetical protein